jgi:hypothetical protein
MGGKRLRNKAVDATLVHVHKRQERVAELYTLGWSQHKIAQDLKVSQQTISLDLKSLRAAWTENSMFSMNEAVGQQLGKLDLVEMRAWESFEISMRGQPVKVRGEDGEPLDPVQYVPWEKVPAMFPGDPKYLEIVKDCVEKRCKIFGIGKEDKVQNNTVNVIGADFWDRVAGPSKTQDVEDIIAAEEAKAIGPRKVLTEPGE